MVLINGCSRKGKKSDPYQGENALAEQKSLIEKHISDPGKHAQLLAILAEFEIVMKDFTAEYTQHHERMRQLTADYDATREDFESTITNFNTKYENLLKTMTAKRMEMKRLTTPEEWKEISGRRKKSILKN